MGGVDMLINNAGISIRHNFLDITPEEWDKVIAVNLTGVFYMAQTAARHMWERGSGVILQTASTNGLVGQPYYADYNATKAGVIELTKSMALELAPKVRVCAIAPGYVLTPMQRAEYTDQMLDAVAKFPWAATPNRKRSRPCLRFWPRTMRPTSPAGVSIDGAETAGGLASHCPGRNEWPGKSCPTLFQFHSLLVFEAIVVVRVDGSNSQGRSSVSDLHVRLATKRPNFRTTTAIHAAKSASWQNRPRHRSRSRHRTNHGSTFAREGASVLLTRPKRIRRARCSRRNHRHGGRATFEPGDVTRAVTASRVTECAVHELGGIHILFDNARHCPPRLGGRTQ